MKTRKLLFYLIGGVSVTGILLFTALVVHLVFIYKGKQNDFRERQLGRIDFQEQLPAQVSSELKAFVLSLPGVDGAYINTNNAILVYSFNPTQQQGSNIIHAVTQKFRLKAKPYRVTRDQLSQGCPAAYRTNPISRFAMHIARQFN